MCFIKCQAAGGNRSGLRGKSLRKQPKYFQVKKSTEVCFFSLLFPSPVCHGLGSQGHLPGKT